jgi:hypothetical protein
MKVEWRESNWPPFLGHGVQFHTGPKPAEESLFAFLAGYEWLNGEPETVVILIRRPDSQFPASFLTEAKALIEKAIDTRKLWQGHVAGGVWAWLNA